MDHASADFSVKPVLTGERVVLRPFRDDDLDAIREALADPEVLQLTGSRTGMKPRPIWMTRAWSSSFASGTARAMSSRTGSTSR